MLIRSIIPGISSLKPHDSLLVSCMRGQPLNPVMSCTHACLQDEIFEVPPGGMSVAQLAGHLAVDPNEVVLKLFMRGLAAKVNQVRIVSSLCTPHK